MRWQVTATNAGGSASAQSAQTGAVAALAPVEHRRRPPPRAAPSTGQTLTTSDRLVDGHGADRAYAYQWLALRLGGRRLRRDRRRDRLELLHVSLRRSRLDDPLAG